MKIPPSSIADFSGGNPVSGISGNSNTIARLIDAAKSAGIVLVLTAATSVTFNSTGHAGAPDTDDRYEQAYQKLASRIENIQANQIVAVTPPHLVVNDDGPSQNSKAAMDYRAGQEEGALLQSEAFHMTGSTVDDIVSRHGEVVVQELDSGNVFDSISSVRGSQKPKAGM